MKYEEIVAKVKKAYAKADTSKVDGHLAVQVDVTGEGEGAFYIEVADGKITVAPFEYYDHDFKVLCAAEEIIAIAEGKKYGFSFGGYASINGTYAQLGEAGVYWSSTTGHDDLGDFVWVRQIDTSYSGVVRFKMYEKSGLSVRCFKDN